jgi:glutaryl-CoA dehydrogenase
MPAGTAAAQFPGVDFYQMDTLLSEEERAVRDAVRAWVDERLMPLITDCYVDGRFPR